MKMCATSLILREMQAKTALTLDPPEDGCRPKVQEVSVGEDVENKDLYALVVEI